MKIRISIAAFLTGCSLTAAASAATTDFTLPWLGLTQSITETSTGTGYLTAFSGSYLDALSFDNARSYFQVPLSSVDPGETHLATLEFFVGGGATDTNVTVTLFDSAGVLGHHFTAPNSVATQIFTITGSATNQLDVSSLLSTAKANSLSHFSLHFAGTTSDIYTQPANGAVMILHLATVPEPSTTMVLGLGAISLAGRRRRRPRQA